MLLQLDGADAVSMVDLLAKMADMNQVIVDLKERLAVSPFVYPKLVKSSPEKLSPDASIR